MTATTPQHRQLETEFLSLLERAGIAHPDEVAHLRRALVFVWYETKAFVLVDLLELPADEAPFEGLDLELLRADVLGLPLEDEFGPPLRFEATG